MENKKEKRERGKKRERERGGMKACMLERSGLEEKKKDVIFHGRWLNLLPRQSLAEDLALCDRLYSVLALFSSTHLIHYYATLTHWQEPGAD